MGLTSQQIELIQQALLSGFPTRDHLTMLMRLKLDVALDAVAEADDNTLRTFKIITWAERTGNVRRLIDGAVAQMPKNPDVAKLKEASRRWTLDTDSEPAPPPDDIPAAPDTTDAAAQATHAYLDYLYARYQYLDFKGMGMSDRVPLRLPADRDVRAAQGAHRTARGRNLGARTAPGRAQGERGGGRDHGRAAERAAAAAGSAAADTTV